MTWFLVYMGGISYIGPLPEASCKMAAAHLISNGVVCVQAAYAYACETEGRPGSHKVCYRFEFPQVTVK